MAVSEGSPFYAQLRAGKDGRLIKVWKLRTMYPAAEERLEQYLSSNPAARLEWERYFKLTNDPRILPGVGHFLRRTSLDELPQIFNVIKGEMSLVGPRPFPKYHLDQFDTSLPVAALQRDSRHHRSVAGVGPQRRRPPGAAGARHLLHPQLVDLDRLLHPVQDLRRGRGRARRPLTPSGRRRFSARPVALRPPCPLILTRDGNLRRDPLDKVLVTGRQEEPNLCHH